MLYEISPKSKMNLSRVIFMVLLSVVLSTNSGFTEKFKLNQVEQAKIGLSLIAGSTFDLDAKYVMNNGAMVYQLKMEFPEDTSNEMSLMTGTKIDAHMENNKATVDSIVDLFPKFNVVRSFLVKYDKNNHVDKYVTNIMCNGIMACTVNGTPLR